MSKNKAQVRGGGTDNNIDSPNNPTITHTHNYSVTLSLKEPTCTAQGEEIQKCSKCDKKQVVTIKALGHDYTDKVMLDSTCTAEGTLKHTCQRCSYNYTTSIALKPHDVKSVYTIDIQPTCTTSGEYSYHCKNCSYTERRNSIDALGHDYINTVAKDSTCTAEGTLKHTCQRCSYNYTTSIALKPHDVNLAYTVDISPTCTTQGEYSYHCKNCSYTERRNSIDKLGHNWGNWQTIPASNCQIHNTQKHTCQRCSTSETTQLASYGPHINSWKTTQEPTCSYSGTKVEYCTLCSLEQGSETIPAKGHSESCYTNQQTGDYVYNQYTHIPYTVNTKALLIPIDIAMGKDILVKHSTVHGNGVSFDLCYTNDHHSYGDGRYYMMSSTQATNYGLIGGTEVNGCLHEVDWVDRDTSSSFMFKVLPPNGYNPHYNYLHLQYLSIGCTQGSNYESVTAYVNPRVEKVLICTQ